MADYRAYARQAATRNGLNPDIFERQIDQESGFNPNAQSPAGAKGIAQFMDGTAKSVGVDPWNPTQALDGAARLMASYVKQYGNYALALAAYNAGGGNLADFNNDLNAMFAYTKSDGTRPFAETESYLNNILGGQQTAGQGGSAEMADPLDEVLAQIEAETGTGAGTTSPPVVVTGSTENYPADRWMNGMPPELLSRIIAVKGQPDETTTIGKKTIDNPADYGRTQIPNPSLQIRYTWADGTYVNTNAEGQVLGGTAVKSAAGPAAGDRKTTKVTWPDGSQWLIDAETGQQIQQIAPSKAAAGLATKTYNIGNRIVEYTPGEMMPTSEGDSLGQVQGRGSARVLYDGSTPITPEEAEMNRLDLEAKRLALAKSRRAMLPEQLQALSDYEQSVAYVRQKMIDDPTNWTSTVGNKYMQTLLQNLDATMKGTTPWAMEQAKVQQRQFDMNTGREILDRRVQTSSSLANSILQGALGANIRMPKGQTTLGIDPFAMAAQYVDQMGGGPEVSAMAKNLLLGASQGQSGGQSQGVTREDVLREYPELAQQPPAEAAQPVVQGVK